MQSTKNLWLSHFTDLVWLRRGTMTIFFFLSLLNRLSCHCKMHCTIIAKCSEAFSSRSLINALNTSINEKKLTPNTAEEDFFSLTRQDFAIMCRCQILQMRDRWEQIEGRPP